MYSLVLIGRILVVNRTQYDVIFMAELGLIDDWCDLRPNNGAVGIYKWQQQQALWMLFEKVFFLKSVRTIYYYKCIIDNIF